MFEDVSGFGAWQRFYFLLEGGHLLYWNSPNEMSNKVGLCNYVCKLVVDRYIGRYLALFKYQLWPISGGTFILTVLTTAAPEHTLLTISL